MQFDALASPATWEVLSKTGRAFFVGLLEHLCHVAGLSAGFVVESQDPRGNRVCPVACWGVADFRGGRCYDTQGTPCERLRLGKAAVYPDRLSDHFPDDEWLRKTGMQSYVGLPLLDAAGHVLGHIGVLDDRPMEDPTGIATLLEAFAARCSAELERIGREEGLSRIIGDEGWVLYQATPPEFSPGLLCSRGEGFLGFSPADLSRQEDLRSQQILDTDRERVLGRFARAFAEGADFVMEYRMWHRDRKSVRRIQDCGHIQRDEQGRPTHIAGVLMDISVRRSSERGRRDGERQILSRIGDFPGLAFRSGQDPAGCLEFVGGSTRPLTGYGPDELLYRGEAAFRDLIVREDRDRVDTARRHALDEGTGYRVRYRLVDGKNETHHVLETGRGIPDSQGQPSALEGFIVDLTEQELSRQELVESEERVRGISAAAQDAILMLDNAGRVAFWNQAACRIFGYAEHEVLGRDAHLLIAPAGVRVQASRGMEAFSISGEGPMVGKTLKLQALRKDGTTFPAELSVSSLRIRGAWHAIGIVRDVTDRERALAAAREFEQRFKVLFEQAADGMLLADRESTRFVAGNRRMAQMLRCSPEAITTLSVHDIHPEDDLPWVLAAFERCAEGDAPEPIDIPVKRRDGTVFSASVTTFKIELDGRPYLAGSFRDITERRRAQKALQEERQRLRSYLDHAPVVTVVFDPAGNTQMINRRGIDLLGCSEDEILGRHWFTEFVAPEDRESAQAAFTRCLGNQPGRCGTSEYSVAPRSGEARRIAWRSNVLVDAANRNLGLMVSGEDVTEQRRVESELSAAQARLGFLVNTVSAVLYICEPVERLPITFVGANLGELFGIDPDRVLDRSGLWLDYAHPDDVPRLTEALPQLLDRGDYSVEFRFKLGAGDYQWVQNGLRLARDAAGQPVEVVGYLLDITERKRTETTLRERKTSLAHAQAIANLGSWETDLATGVDQWSDEVYRILGYAPRAFRPTQVHLTKRIHPGDKNLFAEHLAQAIAEETGFDFEFKIVRPNGEHRHVRARGEILRNERGESRSIVGTLLDLTDRKRAEASLEQSRQSLRDLAAHLQSVREEERTQIAREMHDEMGQALTAMKIDLVRLRSRIGSPAEARPLLASMQQSIDEGIGSVQRIMSQLRPSMLDDLGLVPAIEWQTEQFQKRTGVRCELSVTESQVQVSREARTALFRILQESLTNVSRHASATSVKVQISQTGDCIRLVVEDNGKGISEGSIHNGRSFGLLGMRERAEVFGGRIDIQGEPGVGTRISVAIPVSALEIEVQ